MALQSIQNQLVFKGNSKKVYTVYQQESSSPQSRHTMYKLFMAKDARGQCYQLKQFPKIYGVPIEKIQKEISVLKEIHSKVDSHNLIQAIDTAEDNKSIFVLFPYYDQGTLENMIAKGLIQSELEAVEYFRQICYGEMVLRRMHLNHGELTPSDISVSTCKLKSVPFHYLLSITNIGYAGISDNKASLLSPKSSSSSSIPTMIESVAIFSLGCILYKMLTKNDLGTKNSFSDYCSPKQTSSTDWWKKLAELQCNSQLISKFTLKVIEGCLNPSLNERWSLSQLVDQLKIKSLYKCYKPLRLFPVPLNRNLNIPRLSLSTLESNRKSSLSSIQSDHDRDVRDLLNRSTPELTISSKKIDYHRIFLYVIIGILALCVLVQQMRLNSVENERMMTALKIKNSTKVIPPNNFWYFKYYLNKYWTQKDYSNYYKKCIAH